MAPEIGRVTPSIRLRRENHNTKLGFAKLPAELRNYIWQLAIPSSITYDTSEAFKEPNAKRRKAANQYALSRQKTRNTASMNPKRYKTDFRTSLAASHRRRTPFTPAITQVCRALRPETLDFFYGSNTFELRTSNTMTYEGMDKWLSRCPQVGLRAIQHIIVDYTSSDNVDDIPCSLRLQLDLTTGVAGDASSGFHWPFSSTITLRANWPADSTYASNLCRDLNDAEYDRSDAKTALGVTVPADVLNEKIKEVRRLHGFGNEEEMTRERLMDIIKAFNFYRKDGYGMKRLSEAAIESCGWLLGIEESKRIAQLL